LGENVLLAQREDISAEQVDQYLNWILVVLSLEVLKFSMNDWYMIWIDVCSGES